MTPLILTSALVGGEWSNSRPRGNTPVPTEKEIGWAPNRKYNMYRVFPVALSTRSLLSAQQRV